MEATSQRQQVIKDYTHWGFGYGIYLICEEWRRALLEKAVPAAVGDVDITNEAEEMVLKNQRNITANLESRSSEETETDSDSTSSDSNSDLDTRSASGQGESRGDGYRKMQVTLHEDYSEKLIAQKNRTKESDMDFPEVKDYKPRKQLRDEVIEQEVYGIDPYTHNLLLDSIPEESDWHL
ncbi:hypothetical protein Tco_0751712, partial [Tanacetum coccineum]